MKNSLYKLIWMVPLVVLSACGGGGGGGAAAPGAPIIVTPPPAPPPAGSAALTWTAPTNNVDGSAAAVAGYNVYRLTPGVTPCPIDISLYVVIAPVPAGGLATVIGSPPAAAFTDTALAAGPYCYGVTALNVFGQESLPTFLANPITVN